LNYVQLIVHANEIVNSHDIDEYQEYVTSLLAERTPRELAIFRNCLYAIKGYKFANAEWTDFFSQYLEGYNGQYSNDAVTAMFTKNEKWLLDLVARYENMGNIIVGTWANEDAPITWNFNVNGDLLWTYPDGKTENARFGITDTQLTVKGVDYKGVNYIDRHTISLSSDEKSMNLISVDDSSDSVWLIKDDD